MLHRFNQLSSHTTTTFLVYRSRWTITCCPRIHTFAISGGCDNNAFGVNGSSRSLNNTIGSSTKTRATIITPRIQVRYDSKQQQLRLQHNAPPPHWKVTACCPFSTSSATAAAAAATATATAQSSKHQSNNETDDSTNIKGTTITTTTTTTTKPTKRNKKDHVVILGTGWAGFNMAMNMDMENIDLTIISPRNHFIFTPLLPSTAVGTLEPRTILEPIRSVLKNDSAQYIQAKARSINVQDHTIQCESIHRELFDVSYDKLVIAVGVKTNTFGIKSIQQGAQGYYNIGSSTDANCIFYLKQLAHARAIRANIVDSFEKASIPTVSDTEKYRLLSFLVVGGGPTSCEFTAELHDFVKQDVTRMYPKLVPYVKITIVEAGPALLGPFDKALQDYAYLLFRKRDIDVKLGTAVIDVEDHKPDGYRFMGKRAILSDSTTIEFGTMVWSAGLAPRTFVVEGLDPTAIKTHPRSKRIYIDNYLRVPGHEGTIWAMGDAAVNVDGIPLPQLAQVARQQGIYLAKVLSNKVGETDTPFSFFSLGSMAFLGDLKGVYDGSSAGPLRDKDNATTTGATAGSNSPNWAPTRFLKGFAALLLWRFAYWGRQTSFANKILIPVHWFKTFFFGRDTSRY